ncbi:MAG: S9 family peptidase [Bacteroidia bacterium]
MIKKYSLLTLISFISLTSFSQKSITLEDIWKNGTFASKGVSGFVPLKDGKTYCRKISNKTGGQYVIKYSYETGNAVDTLIHNGRIAKANGITGFQFDGFQFNSTETQAILTNETEQIYRHSSASQTFILDLATATLTKVADKKIMYPAFDPAGKYVAYVFENNLFVKDLKKNKIKTVTKDGKRNSIINGAVDWVYEEEFSMSRGYEWNDDGSAIAYYKFDETNVTEFGMNMYEGLYPTNYTFKYPKAGEANSIVDVFIYSVKGGKSKKMEAGSENDQYLPRIKWTKNNTILSIQRLNRLQNKWEILLADAKTGKTKVAFEETDKYYIDITDDLTYLPGGELVLMTSERDGYRHIYLHKTDGPEIMQTTKGPWDVADILGYNEKTKQVYYSSFETSPLEKHIYKIDLDGKNKMDLTAQAGMHSASFSADFSYYLHSMSTINSPAVTSIYNSTGTNLRVLEDNNALRIKMQDYKISMAEFGQLPIENNINLNYWMIKPKDFDPAKKYPLLMFVYGGPGSQQVLNSWGGGNYWWHQMLANEKGYIVVCVDNRGTGARGAEFKKMTYKQLGKYESDDQIAAAMYFGSQSYIDATRIGIWGWSYGGFMSSTCITKGADVFKAAIAVAPVTNWRFYDNIYTERYMQLPKDNADGYDSNSPINMVEKLKGKYLLVHGTGDDNVHFQNSAEMVEKMVEQNKPFQSAYYPNKSHGISGGNTRLHLFTLMTNFLLENL